MTQIPQTEQPAPEVAVMTATEIAEGIAHAVSTNAAILAKRRDPGCPFCRGEGDCIECDPETALK